MRMLPIGSYRYIQVVLIIATIPLQLCTELKCPVQSHRHLRAKSRCNTTDKYICLFDENLSLYADFCGSGPQFEPTGFKQILIGGLSRWECSSKSFQPFIFWTNESSDCVFLKSACSGEGQLVYSHGTTKSDQTCHCDYNKNYTFITKPRHQCFCVPSEEDCSCFVRECPDGYLLDPDYECVAVSNWKTNSFTCKVISETPDNEDKTTTLKTVTNIVNERQRFFLDAIVTTVLMIVMVILLVVCYKQRMQLVKEDKCKAVIPQNSAKKPNIISNKASYDTICLTDNQKGELQDMHQKQHSFAVTHAAKYILRKLKNEQCLVITGPPGSGKSSIAYHCAFQLEKEETYSIIPIFNPEEINKFVIKERKQIFLFDDVFGRYTIDNSRLEKWKKEENTVRKILEHNPETKILITCRSYIYKRCLFAKVSHFPTECDLHSDMLRLSLNERREICQLYLDASVSNNLDDNMINMYNFFPLMCYECRESDEKDVQNVLINPHKILQHEMNNFKEMSDVGYLSLALLVVLNGNIGKIILALENHTGDDEIINDVINESEFFNLPSKSNILSCFDALIGTYVNETETGYTFLHEKLFENISFCLGKQFLHTILKHGDSEFIRDRLQFFSLNQPPHSELTIMLEQKDESLYFNRQLADIQKGRNWAVFGNIQMQFRGYRNKLNEFLKVELKQEHLSLDTDLSTPLHVIAAHGDCHLAHLLIQIKKEHVFNKDSVGRIPLHLACKNGNTDIVQELINFNSPVDNLDKENLTPLDYACINGHFKPIQVLLQNGANINLKQNKRKSAMHFACEIGNTEMIKFLLKRKANINEKDNNGQTPLHLACVKNRFETVRFLLAITKKINEKDNLAQTPLFVACKNRCVTIVEELLINNASANIPNANGDYPLHISCIPGHDVITQYLLKYKAEVNVRDSSGKTPIYIASEKGLIKVVSLLLSYNANVDIKDKNGLSPFFVCCSKGHVEIMKLLKDKGAKINDYTNAGITPLYVASNENQSEVVGLLLELKADVNMTTKHHATPLHAAFRNNNIDIARTLLDNGAHINNVENDGCAPLHIACKNGNKSLTDLSITYNANTELKDKFGKTPLMLAQENGHNACAEILNKYTAYY